MVAIVAMIGRVLLGLIVSPSEFRSEFLMVLRDHNPGIWHYLLSDLSRSMKRSSVVTN